MTLLEAINDQKLFGRWFRDPATWQPWFAFVAALFGLPMTAEQEATYRKHTGREYLPLGAFMEAWLICGRRAGKSFILALIAVFLACFKSYGQYLGPGERGTVMVIAADRKQARVIMRYVRGIITGTPMLAKMIEGQLRADGIDLNNSVTIEVGTASFRTSRGYAFVAVLCDELAFWQTDEAAEPDYAVLDALRPGMASIPGSVLLCASSPYAKRGALWDAYKTYFGKDDPAVMVWRASTREMNATIPQSVIDRAMVRDAASASAEYGADFRTDVQTFISREAIEAVVEPNCLERPPVEGIQYVAAVDPSGGSSDSMTLAIAHFEQLTGIAVLDCVREVKPPFSPDSVCREFAETIKAYGIATTRGDRYAGVWPREAMEKHGITYRVSDLVTNDLYRQLLPRINSGKVDLLDHPVLINQLAGLERRTARGGRDSIDHPPMGHDDVCAAASMALHYAADGNRIHITGADLVGRYSWG
ncbi:hypothetical protein [Bradyrhizobium sp. MOS002]|uniref:hypothetical protein n=1 Tax=Bradyrhizobium sp. MOS002 TaxID=2133947 RepID=UPI000D11606E|nr:hypothetical protein [Bradyrhizobium sp. MOS002]PSO29844.1 hypothetical protein C7G41_24175 [Bradyrhizobium sp. MOS002]